MVKSNRPTFGWIYCVACKMYSADQLHKLGYVCTQQDSLKAATTLLLGRYATTLLDPQVLLLLPVSNARRAESDMFEQLTEYRLHARRELFSASFADVIQPAMQKVGEAWQRQVSVVDPCLRKTRKRACVQDARMCPVPKKRMRLGQTTEAMCAEALGGLAEVLPKTRDEAVRAEILGRASADKQCAELLCNIYDEFGAACPRLEDKLGVIRQICEKLGLQHTFDVSHHVDRSTIDNRMAEFQALISDAFAKFGVRDRAKVGAKKPSGFRQVITSINVVFRRWSGVELKDATNGKRPPGPGRKYAARMMLVMGEFAHLFVE